MPEPEQITTKELANRFYVNVESTDPKAQPYRDLFGRMEKEFPSGLDDRALVRYLSTQYPTLTDQFQITDLEATPAKDVVSTGTPAPPTEKSLSANRPGEMISTSASGRAGEQGFMASDKAGFFTTPLAEPLRKYAANIETLGRKIPKDLPMLQMSAGSVKGFAEMGIDITSPANLALMGASIVRIPKAIIQKAPRLYKFGKVMFQSGLTTAALADLGSEIPEVAEALKHNDSFEAGRHATKALADLFLAGGLVKSGVRTTKELYRGGPGTAAPPTQSVATANPPGAGGPPRFTAADLEAGITSAEGRAAQLRTNLEAAEKATGKARSSDSALAEARQNLEELGRQIVSMREQLTYKKAQGGVDVIPTTSQRRPRLEPSTPRAGELIPPSRQLTTSPTTRTPGDLQLGVPPPTPPATPRFTVADIQAGIASAQQRAEQLRSTLAAAEAVKGKARMPEQSLGRMRKELEGRDAQIARMRDELAYRQVQGAVEQPSVRRGYRARPTPAPPVVEVIPPGRQLTGPAAGTPAPPIVAPEPVVPVVQLPPSAITELQRGAGKKTELPAKASPGPSRRRFLQTLAGTLATVKSKPAPGKPQLTDLQKTEILNRVLENQGEVMETVSAGTPEYRLAERLFSEAYSELQRVVLKSSDPILRESYRDVAPWTTPQAVFAKAVTTSTTPTPPVAPIRTVPVVQLSPESMAQLKGELTGVTGAPLKVKPATGPAKPPLVAAAKESPTPVAVAQATGPAAVPTPSATAAPTLPRDLAGAKPRYSYGSRQFDLEFANDLDKAAYITAQVIRSKRDAQYLAWAMNKTGLPEAEIRAAGGRVRKGIKGLAKDAEPGTIRVPSFSSPAGMWGATPAPPALPTVVAVAATPELIIRGKKAAPKAAAKAATGTPTPPTTARMAQSAPEPVGAKPTELTKGQIYEVGPNPDPALGLSPEDRLVYSGQAGKKHAFRYVGVDGSTSGLIHLDASVPELLKSLTVGR